MSSASGKKNRLKTKYQKKLWPLRRAALGVSTVRPRTARDGVAVVNDWTRRNARAIVFGVSLLIGLVLLVRGVLTVK